MHIYLFSAIKTTTPSAKTEGAFRFHKELDDEEDYFVITSGSEAEHVKEFMGRVGRNEAKRFVVVAPTRAAALRILQAIFPRNRNEPVKRGEPRPWSYC